MQNNMNPDNEMFYISVRVDSKWERLVRNKVCVGKSPEVAATVQDPSSFFS
ncbi:MAG: hypothetical protein ACLUD0_21150 [Eubacterium ramulus]